MFHNLLLYIQLIKYSVFSFISQTKLNKLFSLLLSWNTILLEFNIKQDY